MKRYSGYWAYDWKQGEEIIDKLGGIDNLKLFLGVDRVQASKYLKEGGSESFCLTTFYLLRENGYDGEMEIMFDDKNNCTNRFQVSLKLTKVPKNFILSILYWFGLYKPKPTIYTSSGRMTGSRYPWIMCPIKEDDVQELEKCIQEVTGKHPNPFAC